MQGERADTGQGAARRRYRGFIRRHLFAVIGLPIIAGLLAGLVASALTPLYEASATLLLGDAPAGEGPDQRRERSETRVLLLQSRGLAEQVAGRLDLWSRPGFVPCRSLPTWAPIQLALDRLRSGWRGRGAQSRLAPTPEQARRAILDALAAGLLVEPVADSRVIRVALRCDDPGLAAELANAYVDTYLEDQGRTRNATVERITERLDDQRRQIEAAETRLREYREQHGLDAGDDLPEGSGDGLEGLSQRLAAARARRDGLRADYQQAKDLDTTDPVTAASHPVLGRNQVIQSLRADEVRADQNLAKLAGRYGPRHPKRIGAQGERDGIRARLRTEITNTVAGLREGLELAETRVHQLEQEIGTRSARAREQESKGPALAALEREVQTKRRLYEGLLAGIDETGAGGAEGRQAARILDRAEVPRDPIAPDRALVIGVASLCGLLLGVLWSLARERRDDRLIVPEAVEPLVGIQTLGTVPILRAKGPSPVAPERAFSDRPHSLFAEAIRTIRTAIVLSDVERPRQVILVTSSLPGEGKGVVAINLAAALACTGRVLLVDADLRRAGIGMRLGLPVEAPGLTEILAGSEDPDDCIHRVEGTGLDLIPSGVLPADPLERLSTAALTPAIEALTRRYDRILINSPPLQVVSDALILSRSAQGLVFVIGANSTPSEIARLAVDRLRRVQAPLLGAVLNRYDPALAARRGLAPSGPGAHAHQGYARYQR